MLEKLAAIVEKTGELREACNEIDLAQIYDSDGARATAKVELLEKLKSLSDLQMYVIGLMREV